LFGFSPEIFQPVPKESPLKSDLQTWLADADFRSVLDAVSRSSRTIGALISLTYAEDPVVGWRAIDAIGRAAEKLSRERPVVFRNYLQRLFWMMSDEAGAVAPHAPEVIGEIVRSDPGGFVDFIPLTVSLLHLEPEDKPRFLPGILYALGRIGEVAPDSIKEGFVGVEDALSDRSALVRVMAVRCLWRIGLSHVLQRHPELARDEGKARIYHEEQLRNVTVSELYTEDLKQYLPDF
jgi:hypothetical protein